MVRRILVGIALLRAVYLHAVDPTKSEPDALWKLLPKKGTIIEGDERA